jgi:hypothetical protein
MSQGIQNAIVFGNLTRDAVVKELGQKGSRAIVFGVAVNGREKNDVTFWDVTCWIGTADVDKFLPLLTTGIRVALINAEMGFEQKKDKSGEFKKLTVERKNIVPLSFKDKVEADSEPSAPTPPPTQPAKGDFPF